MNYERTKTHEQDRVLFVWDGSNRHIRIADRLLKEMGRPIVYIVHALPHESIYSYGTVGQSYHETCELERNLTRAFRQMTCRTDNLNRGSFRLLFGERICEVARYASLIKAKMVLTPLFEQSSFSRWIHGDLNSRLAKKLHCKTVFFGDEGIHSQVNSEHAAMQRHVNESK